MYRKVLRLLAETGIEFSNGLMAIFNEHEDESPQPRPCPEPGSELDTADPGTGAAPGAIPDPATDPVFDVGVGYCEPARHVDSGRTVKSFQTDIKFMWN